MPAAPKLLEICTQVTCDSHVENKVYSLVVNAHMYGRSVHKNAGMQLGNVDHGAEDTDKPELLLLVEGTVDVNYVYLQEHLIQFALGLVDNVMRSLLQAKEYADVSLLVLVYMIDDGINVPNVLVGADVQYLDVALRKV